MIRIILGAIAGFVVWSVLWVGSDAVFMAVSTWYRENLEAFQKAIETKTEYTVDSTILIFSLIRSVVCSVISGLIAALISKEPIKSPLLAGIFLLAFGIFIQSVYWNYVPLWYHIPFLFLLIPMTLLGGKLQNG
jgi:undecaprenyl pyrophosphate phosphatase UppP